MSGNPAPSPGSSRQLACAVVLPYVAQRIFLGCVAIVAMEFVPEKRGFHALPHLAGLDAWIRWDSEYYITIAEHGYGMHGAVNPNAFFPFYPALSALVGKIVPVPIAAWLVANLAAVTAICLLYLLARDLEGAVVARRAALMAIVFPTSYFLSSVYAESTYLALAIGAILLASRGRQVLAAALVFLACLSRPQGFLCLTIPFAAGWLIRSRKAKELPWFVLAAGPAALALLLIYRSYTGDAFAFLHSGTVQSLGAFRDKGILRPPSKWAVLLDEGLGPNLIRRLLNWSALGLVAVGALDFFRRRNWEMALISTFAMGIPLFFHHTFFDAASMARYALLAFPIFISLGRWTRRSSTAWIVDTGFMMLQTVLFALFACWYWVE